MYDELSENELKAALAQSRKNEVRTVDWPTDEDMVLLAKAATRKATKVTFANGRVFSVAYHEDAVLVQPDNEKFPRVPCGWFNVEKLKGVLR